MFREDASASAYTYARLVRLSIGVLGVRNTDLLVGRVEDGVEPLDYSAFVSFKFQVRK